MSLAHAHIEVSRGSLELCTPYEAPRGELETIIADIFAEIFGLDRVGANDHFFDLGGDSLIAEVFAMRVRERTGYDFSLASLFENGSPRAIAELLRGSASKSPDGGRPPIFMVHGRNGISFPRPDFVQSLNGQKLRLFELPGLRSGHCYNYVEDIAAAYVVQLLDEYPKGPILLGAFCAGGLIALEMAAQLAKRGRSIHHLVLLDPPMHAGTLGRGASDQSWMPIWKWWPPRKWISKLRKCVRPASLVRREHELRYYKTLVEEMVGNSVQRAQWADFPYSMTPRAKLLAACRVYRPNPYHGPVTVFSSEEPDSAFRAGSNLSNLLPQSRVELVAKTHSDIVDPAMARAMQLAFDQALRGHGFE
jgi:thioesterase domain-containing protein/acyl carrier protein